MNRVLKVCFAGGFAASDWLYQNSQGLNVSCPDRHVCIAPVGPWKLPHSHTNDFPATKLLLMALYHSILIILCQPESQSTKICAYISGCREATFRIRWLIKIMTWIQLIRVTKSRTRTCHAARWPSPTIWLGCCLQHGRIRVLFNNFHFRALNDS